MTTFQKVAGIFIAGVAFAVAVVGAFEFGRHCCPASPTTDPEIKVDTLFIRDTILVKTPEIVEKEVIRTQLVPVVDTLRLHDTLYLALDRERVVWRDNLSEIWASGIDPSIDSVRHYVSTQVVTVEKTVPVEVKVRPKWSVGVGVGMMVVPTSSGIQTAPGVGVSVNRNILSW